MNRLYKILLIFFGFLLFGSPDCNAQNAAARYEIDAKRLGVDPKSEDALPRSREFIRLDSTYYVGWFYEGYYKYDHSSDFQGYALSAVPLKKAFDLIQKDFSNYLARLYTDRNTYMQYVRVYQDFLTIADALAECYDNTEQPEKTFQICDVIDAYNFPKDFFGTYSRRAWLYHRFRTFTGADYRFLKANITENESAAFQQCYFGLSNIANHKEANDAMYGSYQALNDQLNIYHYLALLHNYNQHYDSSEYYYHILAENGVVSWNNYAGLKEEQGYFRTAYDYFQKDLYGRFDHMLKEPAYFIPILQVFAGKPKDAARLVTDIIAQNGSTPGFGWYNIALARAFLYNGQLDSCTIALQKAAGFREVHIGTTLTQEQYDFSIQLLKVQLLDRQIALQKFLHRHWYFSWSATCDIITLKVKKFFAEYIANNMLASLKDRKRLFYDLFCSESTTTFDEAWYLMKDYSTPNLVRQYQAGAATDKRMYIKRYFQLVAAKLEWAVGDYAASKKEVEDLLTNAKVDTEFEKLFLGRLYEQMILLSDKSDNIQNKIFYTNELLKTYKQLIPYAGISASMRLEISGGENALAQNVISDVKKWGVNWTDSRNVPVLQLSFSANAVRGILQSADGRAIGATSWLNVQNSAQAERNLVFQIFGQ